MKTRLDPRHKKRQRFVQLLYQADFRPDNKSPEISEILEGLDEIDKIIKNLAPRWPIEKIAKADLAILRLAIYELKIKKNEPPKVIIDEAVELAREFGDKTSGRFINGVLGKLLPTP
ncbi:MAG: transcription antitermination factor NusB [bacterium]|nr:transcription antitermination factor NusB [bacterium]